MDTLHIPARFNGPPDSGNGGYTCGRLAAYVEADAVVRLLAPPPLDKDLAVARQPDGSVTLLDGDQTVATAKPAALSLAAPAAPSLALSREARERFPCYHNHPLATCFVCGPGRPDGDGLQLFTGPVGEADMVASPWEPGQDLLDGEGNVRPEFVWAALDCPGAFAALGELSVPVLLGEQHLSQRAPVPAGQALIVYAWPLGSEGRKHYSGAAVATACGEVLAVAKTTWIVLKT